MAGTLWQRLKVEHVYQRRFGDSAAFAQALGNSHWYMISRRPAIRVVAESVQLHDDAITADFITRPDSASSEHVYTWGSDFRSLGSLHDFQAYKDGAYFSLGVGEDLMHGDAWALASFLSQAESAAAKQEVLYVGQAFGENGSKNSWERTRKHEKLQRIYEDHVDSGYEIFIAPLSTEKGGFVSDDHIDDTEDGPSLESYYSNFVDLEGRTLQTTVDLIEHSLIAYFSPPYNSMLTEWRPDQPTKSMQRMRAAGFRLIHVHLSGWWGLARFHSSQEPDAPRSHFISHDIPPTPREGSLRGISAPQLSDWRIGALLAREGKQIFADRSEDAAVLLRVFGEEAPVDRMPVDIKLHRTVPAEPSTEVRAEKHYEIRNAINEIRKKSEPIRHDGKSTYEAETGTVAVGVNLSDGTQTRIRLHDPNSNEVDSSLIIGDRQSGKSNSLRVLVTEAFLACKFLVFALDPSGQNGFSEMWGDILPEKLIATNLSDATSILSLAQHIVNERLEQEYQRNGQGASNIIVAIDDADSLLRDELSASIVTDLLQRGSQVGVGLLIAVSDISEFSENIDLMHALMSCKTKHGLMPNARNILADLGARYGKRRSQSWVAGKQIFILHRGAAGSTIGFLVAVLTKNHPSQEVREWCTKRLTEEGVPLSKWKPISREPDCWQAFSFRSAQFYEIRKHEDCWAVVQIVSSIFDSTLQESIDILTWAQKAIDFRFSSKQSPWQVGPTTSHANALTMYSDVQGPLIKNDIDDATLEAFIEMY